MKNLINKQITYWLIGLAVVCATLLPITADATTYYVAKTGQNSNSGTEISPFRSIQHGTSKLSAGDTLYVKAGTYYESILSWHTNISNGTSWDNPITISANPGDTVIINPRHEQAFFWIQDGQAKYLIINGFVIDGRNTALHGFKFSNNSRYIRVQNSEIKNTKYSGILSTICSGCPNPLSAPQDTYLEFKNLNVHHNGSSIRDHGFYIETSHNLVEHTKAHHNSGHGGKFFSGVYAPGVNHGTSANYNILRYNTLYENSQKSWYPNDPSNIVSTNGWLIASGVGNEAYGNITHSQPHGLIIGNGARNTLIYNNIAYNNVESGITVHGSFGGSENARIFNNTVYSNGKVGISVIDGAKDTVVKNNISFKNGSSTSWNLWLEPNDSPGTTTSHNFLNNPDFVDAAAHNFKLRLKSPAIDAGIDISEVTTDIFGVERTQGNAYDIGAIELEQGEDTFPPSPPATVTIN